MKQNQYYSMLGDVVRIVVDRDGMVYEEIVGFLVGINDHYRYIEILKLDKTREQIPQKKIVSCEKFGAIA